MPWPATFPHRATSYGVTATNWNDIMDGLNFLREVGYAEFTSDVHVTATSVGTGTLIVSLPTITYENQPHMIEFFIPRVVPDTAETFFVLVDGSTVLGTIGSAPANGNPWGVLYRRRLTPSAASHTYKIRGWVNSAANTTLNAGSGGAAGDNSTFLPGYLRVCAIPT